MSGRADGVSGIESSQRRPCQRMRASTKRVVRISPGTPLLPVSAQASARVRKERSGVSSAREKIGRVGIIVHSVLTLMEPMFSMAIRSAAEALKLMPRNGGSAPAPLTSRIAASKSAGIGLEHS